MDANKNKIILYLACRQLGMNVSPNEKPDNLMRLLLCEPVELTPTTVPDEKTFCTTKARELRATSLMSREAIQEEAARLWAELKQNTITSDMIKIPNHIYEEHRHEMTESTLSLVLKDRRFHYFRDMR